MGYLDEKNMLSAVYADSRIYGKKKIFGVAVYIREGITNEGGEGPARIFCHLFISAFLVNKRSLFPPKCQ